MLKAIDPRLMFVLPTPVSPLRRLLPGFPAGQLRQKSHRQPFVRDDLAGKNELQLAAVDGESDSRLIGEAIAGSGTVGIHPDLKKALCLIELEDQFRIGARVCYAKCVRRGLDVQLLGAERVVEAIRKLAAFPRQAAPERIDLFGEHLESLLLEIERLPCGLPA
jgi:hypothetical protein